MASICNCSECEGKMENWSSCLGCLAKKCDMGQCGPEGWHYRNREEGWYCSDCFYRDCDWEGCEIKMTLDAASKGKRFSLAREGEEIEVCDCCVEKARAEGWGDEEDEDETAVCYTCCGGYLKKEEWEESGSCSEKCYTDAVARWDARQNETE